MPGFVRDCLVHAYACDCILEDKCVLLQATSVDQWPVRGNVLTFSSVHVMSFAAATLLFLTAGSSDGRDLPPPVQHVIFK